jgi:hypothetical protein
VLLEQGLVALHGHGGHAGVEQLGPSLGAHVHLGELEDLAERHQHLAAETVEHAVGVVLLRHVGVFGAGVVWEEAAGDGLTEQRRPVERRARRGAPLGGESDLPPVAAGRELLEVRGEEVGEEVGDGVEEEATGAVAVVRLQRLHGELGRLLAVGDLLLRRGYRLLINIHRLGFRLHILHRLITRSPLCLHGRPGDHGFRLAAPLGLGGEHGGDEVGKRGFRIRLDRGRGLRSRDATASAALPAGGQLGTAGLLGLAHLLPGGRLLLGGLAGVSAVDEAVEQLGEVLEVAELGEGGDVAGKRPGVVGVHPKCGGVEPLPVGLASAAHAAEAADELELGERVAGPDSGEEAVDALRGGVGDDLEEEVEAGVAGVGVGGGVVLRARQARLGVGGVGGVVEAGIEEVEEAERLRVGVSIRGERRRAGPADGGRAEEDKRGHGGRHRSDRLGFWAEAIEGGRTIAGGIGNGLNPPHYI